MDQCERVMPTLSQNQTQTFIAEKCIYSLRRHPRPSKLGKHVSRASERIRCMHPPTNIIHLASSCITALSVHNQPTDSILLFSPLCILEGVSDTTESILWDPLNHNFPRRIHLRLIKFDPSPDRPYNDDDASVALVRALTNKRLQMRETAKLAEGETRGHFEEYKYNDFVRTVS